MKPRYIFNPILTSILILIALLLTITTPALAYFAPSNGQAASLVLGQPNFTGTFWGAAQNKLDFPEGVAVDPGTHKIFVADFYNDRVLRFASVPALNNGAAAEAVFGQPNFTSSTAHATQNGMNRPMDIFVDSGGRLWVADWANHRVLRFDHASTLPSGANANGVLGQSNFTSHAAHTTRNGMNNPGGLFVDAGGRLWVVDVSNSRVLRFDNASSKTNGANADGELGQPNFTTSTTATTQNGMYYPNDAVVDTGGRLWVADYSNNRVLRFDNAAAKANGANANGVLGEPNFNSTAYNATQNGMSRPASLALDNTSGRLYVADSTNSRVLVFNGAASLPNGADASYVLGQKNFTTGTSNTGGLSANTLWEPAGVFYDPVAKVLWVADTDNNRVLMYGKPTSYFSSTSTAANDGWVLESTSTSNVGGSMSASGTLRVGDDASNRQYLSILSFTTSAIPDNAVIHSVTLKFHKAGVVGTDPFSTSFGWLEADMKKGTFGAAALENSDFQAPASEYVAGHFSAISSQPGWYQMVLPSTYFQYINLTGTTQFRLRFALSSNNNHVADYDTFYAGDAATSTDRPLLSIEYSLP
jgi:sugar lactone lactonase YvrE